MNFDLDIWTYIKWKCDFKMYFSVTVSFIPQGNLIGQGWHMASQYFHKPYDEESDHSNKAVRKTPEIESGHKVSEEVKWT